MQTITEFAKIRCKEILKESDKECSSEEFFQYGYVEGFKAASEKFSKNIAFLKREIENLQTDRKPESYSLELKMKVVEKYKKGKYGYKKLAKEFNLSRDLVRSWCLNPLLIQKEVK